MLKKKEKSSNYFSYFNSEQRLKSGVLSTWSDGKTPLTRKAFIWFWFSIPTTEQIPTSLSQNLEISISDSTLLAYNLGKAFNSISVVRSHLGLWFFHCEWIEFDALTWVLCKVLGFESLDFHCVDHDQCLFLVGLRTPTNFNGFGWNFSSFSVRQEFEVGVWCFLILGIWVWP